MSREEVTKFLNNLDLQHLNSEQLHSLQHLEAELFGHLLPYTTLSGITIGHNHWSLTTRFGMLRFDNGYYGQQPDDRNYYLTMKFDFKMFDTSFLPTCPIFHCDMDDLERIGQMVRETHSRAAKMLTDNN